MTPNIYTSTHMCMFTHMNKCVHTHKHLKTHIYWYSHISMCTPNSTYPCTKYMPVRLHQRSPPHTCREACLSRLAPQVFPFAFAVGPTVIATYLLLFALCFLSCSAGKLTCHLGKPKPPNFQVSGQSCSWSMW